jgi:hypothetical protein
MWGYALEWITFRHPLHCLAGDFVMCKDMLLGRLPW